MAMAVNLYVPQHLDPVAEPGQPEMVCPNCRRRWDAELQAQYEKALASPYTFGSPGSSKNVLGRHKRTVMECVAAGTHQPSVLRADLLPLPPPSIPLLCRLGLHRRPWGTLGRAYFCERCPKRFDR